MAKNNNWEWLKRGIMILIGLGTLVGMATGASNWFARSKTVNLINKRLDLSMADDDVHRKEADVRWTKQQIGSEPRKQLKTTAEIEIIKRDEQRVIEARKIRDQKQKAYESSK